MVSTAQATERIPPDNSRVRGRPFANGNPGRKPGSRNRATMITNAIGDKDREELIQKGLELAKQGDPPMLKFFLERIMPKEWHLRFQLPAIETRQDVVKALALILKADFRWRDLTCDCESSHCDGCKYKSVSRRCRIRSRHRGKNRAIARDRRERSGGSGKTDESNMLKPQLKQRWRRLERRRQYLFRKAAPLLAGLIIAEAEERAAGEERRRLWLQENAGNAKESEGNCVSRRRPSVE